MARSQIKSGAIFSYLSMITNIIVGLLIAPVMLKYLGDTESSLYNLIGALIGYISVLDFGIGNAIARYVAKYQVEKKEVEQKNFLGTAFLLYLFFALIVIIIGLFIQPHITFLFQGKDFTLEDIEKAKTMFTILIANLAFSLISNAFPAIMNGYGKFSFQKIITWIRTIIRTTLLLILLMTGYNSVAIVILDTILNVIMAIIFAVYVFVYLKVKITIKGWNKVLIREITGYSFYIFLDMVINQVYWKLGQMILSICGATSIQINTYAYGMTIPNYYIMISTVLATMFLPTITKIISEKDSKTKLTDLMIRVGRIQLIVIGLILVGFLLIGHNFIGLWLGERYSEAFIVAISVMIAMTVPLVQNIGIVILQAKNMMKFRVFSYLGICTFNVIFSFLVAPLFGTIGVALVTVISVVLGDILIIGIYYHKKVGLDIIRTYKETFKGLLLGIILSIGSLFVLLKFIIIPGWLGLIIKGIVVTICYMLIMWFVGMNSYEKDLVKNPIKRALLKVKKGVEK